MSLLVQFLLRLVFGLALSMAITSPRQVTSGYFRNHLYVTLGLASLAALLSQSLAMLSFWPAIAAIVFSYLGSACWLYEKTRSGRFFLGLVCLSGLVGIGFTFAWNHEPLSSLTSVLMLLAPISSGLLLGFTMGAMLLGHWYLNSPTMELKPLRKLILAMGAAVSLQAILSVAGLWGEIIATEHLTLQWILFVVLRWTFGLLGVGTMTWMAWQTLNIPNTQSATGILYVAVIGTFVGETMALLLSSESLYPL